LHPFQHFRLKRSPFEAGPDPRMFCATEPHAEALATLEYAIYSRKPCTVLVGECGTGKTLLARMMAATASLQATVLWLHGLGQPETHSELHVFPRGALSGAAPSQPPVVRTFSDWLRNHSRASPSTVLIVDNADELPSHGWRDILTLLSREVPFSEPVRIGLFGSPALLRRLESPNMVQVRRRVFRTAALRPLSRREICAYLSGRLAAAGGRLEDIFTPDALDQIHRLTRGIPAAINQLCENAMLEAVSGRRTRISAADILAAAQAVNGQGPALHAIWKRVALLNEPQLWFTALPETCTSEAVSSLLPPISVGQPVAVATLPLPIDSPAAGRKAPVRQPRVDATVFAQQVQQLEQKLHRALASLQRACAVGQAALAGARQAGRPCKPRASIHLATDSACPQHERA
jgi:general secretion pathway protein A